MLDQSIIQATSSWPFVEARKLVKERRKIYEKKGKIKVIVSYVDSTSIQQDVRKKFLKDYEKIRRADILGLVLATHSLNKLFSIKKSPIKLFRKVGMSAIQKSPYIKRIFMRYAMGL